MTAQSRAPWSQGRAWSGQQSCIASDIDSADIDASDIKISDIEASEAGTTEDVAAMAAGLAIGSNATDTAIKAANMVRAKFIH